MSQDEEGSAESEEEMHEEEEEEEAETKGKKTPKRKASVKNSKTKVSIWFELCFGLVLRLVQFLFLLTKMKIHYITLKSQ